MKTSPSAVRRLILRALASLVLVLSLSGVRADSIPSSASILGTWYGNLSVSQAQLKIVFHIGKSDTGLTATMDSPDQRAFAIRMDDVGWKDGTMTLKSGALHAQFAGRLSADG